MLPRFPWAESLRKRVRKESDVSTARARNPQQTRQPTATGWAAVHFSGTGANPAGSSGTSPGSRGKSERATTGFPTADGATGRTGTATAPSDGLQHAAGPGTAPEKVEDRVVDRPGGCRRGGDRGAGAGPLGCLLRYEYCERRSPNNPRRTSQRTTSPRSPKAAPTTPRRCSGPRLLTHL